MASLQKKKVHGKWYWYIVECRRINGKPRPFVLEYLGTPETLLKRLRGEGKKFFPWTCSCSFKDCKGDKAT